MTGQEHLAKYTSTIEKLAPGDLRPLADMEEKLVRKLERAGWKPLSFKDTDPRGGPDLISVKVWIEPGYFERVFCSPLEEGTKNLPDYRAGLNTVPCDCWYATGWWN